MLNLTNILIVLSFALTIFSIPACIWGPVPWWVVAASATPIAMFAVMSVVTLVRYASNGGYQ